MNPSVTLHLGDCLDVLKTLPDGSVDAVVTDPPYGISYKNKRRDVRPREFAPVLASDGSQLVGQAAIDSCFDLGLPVLAFAHHRKSWAGPWRQWLVWDKGGAVGGGGDGRRVSSSRGNLSSSLDSANCLAPEIRPYCGFLLRRTA